MTIVRELVTLLRYQVDRSGLKAYAQKAQAVGRQVGGIGRAAMQQWRLGVRDALEEYDLVPGKLMHGIREQRRLNAEQRRSVRNVKDIGGGYTAMAGQIRRLFGAYLGYQGVKGFFLGGDEFGQTEARLRNATKSAEEFLLVDKALAANSRESYKPFSANAELFIRTNDVLKAMGKTTQDTLDVVSATNLSLAASGATAQKASNFIDQFGKALGKGKLDGNAFDSMLQNNQTMIKYLVAGLKETAPALGATEANLQKLITAGKITTDAMIPALRSQIAKMRRDVEAMPVSLGDAMTVFRDRAARVSWEFEKQVGIIRKLTKSLEFAADHLKNILHLLWLVGASWGLRRLAGYMSLVGLRTGGVLTSIGLATKAALGLASAMSLRRARGAIAILAAFRRHIRPMLRLMAIFETIRLVIGDISGWLKGYDSVLGDIIGGSEKWRAQLEWVKRLLATIKDALGGVSMTLGEWIAKLGTVGMLIWGLWALLKPLAGFVLRWIVAPITIAIAGVIGWPAVVAAAVAAIAAIIYTKFDSIKAFIDGIWDSVTHYFKNKWTATLGWLEGKLKEVLPEGWVLSNEKRDSMLENMGRRQNPYADSMGALQRPQSFNSNQSNSIVNNTTINANTNNPATLANTASQAVGRATSNAVRGRWVPPNVEAAA